jgi:putative resolvase
MLLASGSTTPHVRHVAGYCGFLRLPWTGRAVHHMPSVMKSPAFGPSGGAPMAACSVCANGAPVCSLANSDADRIARRGNLASTFMLTRSWSHAHHFTVARVSANEYTVVAPRMTGLCSLVILLAFQVVLWYTICMKLSDYAKEVGVTYKTAYQWWKAGQLNAYQLPTGTIIVREPKAAATGVALYARVSSADQKDDVTRQMQRLRDYAAARGYQVVTEVTEIASGLNDERPKLTKLLTDARVGVLVVERRDRLTRFGYSYIAALLEHEGRRVEAIFPTDTGDDLVEDFVAVITNMAARIYGRRHAKRRAAHIQACVKQCIEQAEEA